MNKPKLSFKWLGSLTNLSTRRSPGKTNSKLAAKHDGSCSRGHRGRGSVDDQSCPHGPQAYARSSEMYTHVGTTPRSDKPRCSRGWRKQSGGGSGPQGQQVQAHEWDRVPESPLLGALSCSTLDRRRSAPARPLPAPPMASPPRGAEGPMRGNERPLRCETASEGAGEGEGPLEAPVENRALSQGCYELMGAVGGAEQAKKQQEEGLRRKQEPGTLDLERPEGRLDSVNDSSGEYVQFSRLDPPSQELQKELEEELKLSSTELMSHAWYHGGISWEVSEKLVVSPGDFLVRDSASSPGDYVLTCLWDQGPLHYLLSRSPVKPGTTCTRVQYLLDREAFNSVPALVHFYVGNREALSRHSKAQIHRPVNRTVPLRYLEAVFSKTGSEGDGPPCSLGGLKVQSVCPWSPSALHPKRSEVYCSVPVSGRAPLLTPPNTSSPANTLPGHRDNRPPDPPGTDRPHPWDREGSGYTELFNSPPPPPHPPPPPSYVERLCAEDSFGAEEGRVSFCPVVETASAFRPGRYHSQLMPGENRALEVGVLRRVKELLAELDPNTAAKHITKADCAVARIVDVSPEVQRMMGVSSGMELLTLPHGRQLRLDLLERFHTMSILLAMELLGCTGSPEERAARLHRDIQIAAQLKGPLGNMFGFSAIMRALELPQVARLDHTWMLLRQRHTEGAILYEKTLRPFMKNLNNGKESCQLSITSVPHIVPLLSLLEQGAGVVEGAEPWETVESSVDVVMCHLAAARAIAQLGGIYRANAESRLKGFQEHPEVSELFQTDFQMRLLWGSRGAGEDQAQRYAKFHQVLTALSHKLEPPGPGP